MKNLFSRIFIGLLGGIVICYLITIGVSLVIGDGNYYPCVPALAQRFGNELTAVVVQMALGVVLGAGFAGASMIWEQDTTTSSTRKEKSTSTSKGSKLSAGNPILPLYLFLPDFCSYSLYIGGVCAFSRWTLWFQSKVSKENAARLAPQITLAARRIRAFELALRLIDRELS